MSSSDEPFDWQAFVPREEASSEIPFSPAAAIEALLQRYLRDVTASRDAVSEAEKDGVAALGQQAVHVAQLGAALDGYASLLQEASLGKVFRHLRLIKDQMLDALRTKGLEVEVPLHKLLSDLGDDVQIEGWRHRPEFTEEMVAEVIEPIVRKGSTLIRPGRVIMGAPPDAVPEASEESA